MLKAPRNKPDFATGDMLAIFTLFAALMVFSRAIAQTVVGPVLKWFGMPVYTETWARNLGATVVYLLIVGLSMSWLLWGKWLKKGVGYLFTGVRRLFKLAKADLLEIPEPNTNSLWAKLGKLNWAVICAITGGVLWFWFGYRWVVTLLKPGIAKTYLAHFGISAVVLASYLGVLELLQPTRKSLQAADRWFWKGVVFVLRLPLFGVYWVLEQSYLGRQLNRWMLSEFDRHEARAKATKTLPYLRPHWLVFVGVVCLYLLAATPFLSVGLLLGLLYLTLIALIAGFGLSLLLVIFSWFKWYPGPESLQGVATALRVIGWICIFPVGKAALDFLADLCGLSSGGGAGSYSGGGGGGGYSGGGGSYRSSSSSYTPPSYSSPSSTPSYTPISTEPQAPWVTPSQPHDFAADMRARDDALRQQHAAEHRKQQLGY